jgi:hypothetical protein
MYLFIAGGIGSDNICQLLSRAVASTLAKSSIASEHVFSVNSAADFESACAGKPRNPDANAAKRTTRALCHPRGGRIVVAPAGTGGSRQ